MSMSRSYLSAPVFTLVLFLNRWVRTGDDEHDGCAVVACNGDEGTKRMEVGKEHAGEKWTDLLGWHTGKIVIGEDGWADFKCPARSLSVWTKEGARGRW